jgi:simple sugar transport system substrate-binding protein/rhamnose transport system substrate-binding protein
MRKTLVLVVCTVFVLAMVLAGCSGAAEQAATQAPAAAESPAEEPAAEEAAAAPAEPAAAETDTTEPAAADSEITIVVMPKLIGIPYFNASETGAMKAGEDFGFNVIYAGPTEADATQQVKMLEDYIAQGVDAIAVAPNDPAGLTPTLQKAAEAGIAVIDWDTAAEKDAVLYSVAQVDPYEEAEHVWGTVFEKMGDERDYAILTGGLEAANLNVRIEAGEAFKAANYPDMNLVTDIIPTNESQQEAYTKTLDLMKSYPDITGIICMSSPTIPGAGQAIQELGLQEETVAIGHGMPNDSAPYLKDGSADIAVLWDVEALGYLAAYIAYCAATGQEVTDGMEVQTVGSIRLEEDGKSIIMGPPLDITAENVDQFDY